MHAFRGQHCTVLGGQQVTPSQQNSHGMHTPFAGSHDWHGGQTTPSQAGRQRPARHTWPGPHLPRQHAIRGMHRVPHRLVRFGQRQRPLREIRSPGHRVSQQRLTPMQRAPQGRVPSGQRQRPASHIASRQHPRPSTGRQNWPGRRQEEYDRAEASPEGARRVNQAASPPRTARRVLSVRVIRRVIRSNACLVHEVLPRPSCGRSPAFFESVQETRHPASDAGA